MTDTFSSFQQSLESPATQVLNIVPSDTDDIAYTSRAINVGSEGYVRITTLGGDIATVFMSAGGAFPVRATRIWATGTTASDIAVMF